MKTITIACKGADTLPLDAIEDFQGTLKKRTKKDIEQIITSIIKYGFSFPFFVWNGTGHNYCLDGHGRIQALAEMRRRGYDLPLFPVTYVEAKDEQEAKQKLLRLNSQYGTMTLESVLEFAGDMKLEMEELSLPGIVFKEENEDAGKDGEIADTLPPVVKRGEVWVLGNHRLMCGNSTLVEDVARLMDGGKADLVFTDPPYGVNYTKKAKEVLKSSEYVEIKNDDLEVKQIAETIWRPAFHCLYENAKDDCSFYVTMPQGGDQMMMMMMMMMSEKWQVKHELIWVKEAPVFSMGRLNYDYQHEPIMYGWKKKHNFYGKGNQKKSVWSFARTENKLHPTMKPVELIENALLNSSKEADVVLDLFGGSGSTLIACENLNRKCYMMELDEHYCDAIINRWETRTGNKAVKID